MKRKRRAGELRFTALLHQGSEALFQDAPANRGVGKWLRAVVQGYFNYFAVPGIFPGSTHLYASRAAAEATCSQTREVSIGS